MRTAASHFCSANSVFDNYIYTRYTKAQIIWIGVLVHIPTSWYEHRAYELSKNHKIKKSHFHPQLSTDPGVPTRSTSTGPLSDLRYRQVRLDLGFIVRMRARQAPLPPITADCHRLLPAIIVAWEISRGCGDKDIRLWLFRPWPSKYLNQ